MRANAYCHRKLKGGRPFGGIIPLVPTPFFSWFHLIDSPLNVALHLDVIRTVLSEKMKDLSIPGFIPFILRKWHSHLIYQGNISALPQWESGIIHIAKTSSNNGIHTGENYNMYELCSGRGRVCHQSKFNEAALIQFPLNFDTSSSAREEVSLKLHCCSFCFSFFFSVITVRQSGFQVLRFKSISRVFDRKS